MHRCRAEMSRPVPGLDARAPKSLRRQFVAVGRSPINAGTSAGNPLPGAAPVAGESTLAELLPG